jgi:hypothetical protein
MSSLYLRHCHFLTAGRLASVQPSIDFYRRQAEYYVAPTIECSLMTVT